MLKLLLSIMMLMSLAQNIWHLLLGLASWKHDRIDSRFVAAYQLISHCSCVLSSSLFHPIRILDFSKIGVGGKKSTRNWCSDQIAEGEHDVHIHIPRRTAVQVIPGVTVWPEIVHELY